MASIAAQERFTLAADRPLLQSAGEIAVRYGLVLVIVWFALMKFTNVEAEGLKPLVGGSFSLGWVYHFFSAQAFSRILGTTELTVALLIALRPISAFASAIGSVGAVGMFLTTLSFLVEPAAWDGSLGGFPAPSEAAGEFLLKDFALLGSSLWCLGEAWSAAVRKRSKLRG